MTQKEHDAKMNDQANKYLERIAELEEQIQNQKYDLNKFRVSLAALKWLWQQTQESVKFET